MTRPWIDGDRVEQRVLLPLDAADLLPADHLAWAMLTLVDELDLAGFEAAYRADGRGRPPYSPRRMLALVLYCHAKGLRSAREIAGACRDDLGAMVITGGRRPGRSSINRFIATHSAALRALLPQTLRLAHAEGLVDLSVIAGDGTKVLANAAMGATRDEEGLLAQIADLQRQVAAAHEDWAAQVAAAGGAAGDQPALFDDEPGGPGGGPTAVPGGGHHKAWRRLRTLSGVLRSRQAALAWLGSHPDTAWTRWQERLAADRARVARCAERLEQARATVQARNQARAATEAAGAGTRGRRPVPVEEHIRVRQARTALAKATARAEARAANPPRAGRVNTTDVSSRIMPGKRDGFDQRHNAQAVACPNQIVLFIGAHPNATDVEALIGAVEGTRANLDQAGITDPIGAALFDSGYASKTNFDADLPVSTLLVAIEKEARQSGRLHDGTSTARPSWQVMATRLDQPGNATVYKRRGAIIEPLFAQLFARFGRGLNYRGEQDVETELHLWAVTHNLLKIARARRGKRRARPG